MFVSRESKGKKKDEEFRAKAGRVAKVNENMYLLTREGKVSSVRGSQPLRVRVLFNSFSRQSSHVAGRQRPYPAEIRQIKAALKVYGPD